MYTEKNASTESNGASAFLIEQEINTNPISVIDGPADPGKRVITLDILRGIAVLSILLLNIYPFASPSLLFDVPVGIPKQAFTGSHAILDHCIVWLTWFFAEGKMRSLFSILFGAGVIMITERYEKGGKLSKAASIFYRRNIWLLVIGLCHGVLLFPGDILVDYSILAMLVLFFLRKIPARYLLTIGTIVWVVLGTAGILNAFGISNDTLKAETEFQSAIKAGSHANKAQKILLEKAVKAAEAATSGVKQQVEADHVGYWDSFADRANSEIGFLMFKSSGLFISYLGAMIFGMGLYKSGFLTNQKSVSKYSWVMIGGYAITFLLTGIGLWELQHSGYSALVFAKWLWIPYCIQVFAGTLANLSLILLLLRINLLKRLFMPFANVGRMALTNYILTSLICGWVFSWGPFKFYGKLEFYQWYCVVGCVWFINLIFSWIWLRYFRFGPVEWIWRCLTYWKLQPLRNSTV
ncbi:DUF418 domain-containing protein [Mucilaginibacter gynuensis]|uniref:DUF418 domain-containing protein n=1 Tax=Mucilaginibacter gynuensis TaxID=1302236 RepID=UPI0031E5B2EE